MSRRQLRVEPASVEVLAEHVHAIESELAVRTTFADDVVAQARRAAASVVLPDRDCTDLPFVTIDPPGARDLDQAMHLERRDEGFRVHYAIADVAAFVSPGDAVDVEAHLRGQTLYAPTHRIPLHPPELSEAAASLLPDEVRPALVWQIDLDETGDGTRVEVFRARVRSRAQHDYDGVQRAVDDGTADEVFVLLREIGLLREQRERERGGVSLPLPDQEIETTADGWALHYRASLPVEGWNEQISLLTGMAAAHLMIYAQVGIVRTLPPAGSRAIAKLHRAAGALGVPWPSGMDYPDFVRTLDPQVPRHAAMLNECTSLLRGAGYLAFDGAIPAEPVHAAIASEYAHATAPLRRLVDRYVGETCVAICAGQPVPQWVREGLPALPALMAASERTVRAFEREVVDLVEAGVLSGSVGADFDGVVIEADGDDPGSGTVMITDPAIEASISAAGSLPVGDAVRVRLEKADIGTRTVTFSLV
jgi:exoribonuclease R